MRILDTSALLSSSEPLEGSVPRAVLHELDRLKTAAGGKGFRARRALRHIQANENPLLPTVVGGTADEAILAARWAPGTVLVTRDVGLSLLFRAAFPGCSVEVPEVDWVLPRALPLLEDGASIASDLYRGYPVGAEDQAVRYFDADGTLVRQANDVYSLVPLKPDPTFGIVPRNREQAAAVHALNSETPLVFLTGPAGTGKTLLAIAAGLQAVEDGHVDRVVVLRNVVPVGEDVGFLPGDLGEKMGAWRGPVEDALAVIKTKKGTIGPDAVEVMPLTYVRGRSYERTWLVVDEAQNLTKDQTKTVLTRVCDTSKAVLCGDPDQVDHVRLDSHSNGLTLAVQAFEGSANAVHVPLRECKRGAIAAEAAVRL